MRSASARPARAQAGSCPASVESSFRLHREAPAAVEAYVAVLPAAHLTEVHRAAASHRDANRPGRELGDALDWALELKAAVEVIADGHALNAAAGQDGAAEAEKLDFAGRSLRARVFRLDGCEFLGRFSHVRDSYCRFEVVNLADRGLE